LLVENRDTIEILCKSDHLSDGKMVRPEDGLLLATINAVIRETLQGIMLYYYYVWRP